MLNYRTTNLTIVVGALIIVPAIINAVWSLFQESLWGVIFSVAGIVMGVFIAGGIARRSQQKQHIEPA